MKNRSSTVRIAFIVSGLGLGGAEAMLVKLLTRIDRSKFTPTVISLTNAPDRAEEVRRLGIELHIKDFGSARGFLFGVLGFLRLVRRIRPDIIQGWMLHGNLASLIAGTCLRIPVIWGVRHSKLVAGPEKKSSVALQQVLRWLSYFPKRIVYNSKRGKRSHEEIGYAPKRSVVIPNGFDTQTFRPCSKIRHVARHSLGIADDAVVIGMVARYHSMKAHDTFLQAAAFLRESHPKTIFLLIGPGCDPTNADLIAQVNELSLSDGVQLIGRRTDVDHLINALDVGTLSSTSGEGFPNTVGEIMCCAVPCVVTDVGDSAWIVGDTGITVPPRDAVALARGWRELVDAGPEVRRAMGARARTRILDRFSIDSVAKEYESTYLQCLNMDV